MAEFLTASATDAAVTGLGDGLGALAELDEPHAAVAAAASREIKTNSRPGLRNAVFMRRS